MSVCTIERCLQDIWQVCRVHVDEEGDYPFRAGTAACWVRIDKQAPVLVRVFGHAVVDVRRTAGLLREINDINSRARTVSVAWDEGVVRVSAMLHSEAMNRASLRHTVNAVALVANDLGPLVATVHGGCTPYEPQEAEN